MRSNDASKQSFNHDAEKGFIVGQVDQGAQKRVAVSVSINFNLKDGTKERGHGMVLHEVPLMRRMHPGGVVDVLPYWPPGVNRTRDLTQEALKNELERLGRAYGTKRPGQTASLLQEVYGATESDQLLNLHAKMAKVAAGWRELEQKGAARLAAKYPGREIHPLEFQGLLSEVITADEIEELVGIIEPQKKDLEEIQLPELDLSKPATSATTQTGERITSGAALGSMTDDGDDTDPVDWMTAELKTRLKLSGEDALAVASLIVEADATKAGSDPDAVKLSTIAALKKSDGSLHATKHQQVLAIAARWREKQKAAETAPAT
jgi:hypothetical protein